MYLERRSRRSSSYRREFQMAGKVAEPGQLQFKAGGGACLMRSCFHFRRKLDSICPRIASD